jgi:dTDP-4-dehydrorhamnose reductase
VRLVVTGKQGQLVRSLEERCAARGVETVRIGRPDVDLRDGPGIASAVEAARGDVLINAAAYTAVDKAESEPELAMAVNRDGAGFAAAAAAASGMAIIQLSTDYVFNGALDRPYREDDLVDPLSVYGRTKLAGERAVSQANPRHAIVRTSWVYSPFGQNFVRTMLRLGESRDRIDVVADQWGSPSNALDLADALIAMSDALLREPDNSHLWGVFHMTGSGATNWAEFAQVVFAEAETRGRAKVAVAPITTAQYPTPAMRPANSRLDGGRLERVFGLRLPDWRSSVAGCVRRLLET